MEQGDWLNLVKEAEVFAKHARHDPDAVRRYEPEFAMRYLYCAITGLGRLMGDEFDSHLLLSLFMTYFVINRPECGDPEVFQVASDGLDVEPWKALSMTEFFEEFGGNFLFEPPRPDALK